MVSGQTTTSSKRDLVIRHVVLDRLIFITPDRCPVPGFTRLYRLSTGTIQRCIQTDTTKELRQKCASRIADCIGGIVHGSKVQISDCLIGFTITIEKGVLNGFHIISEKGDKLEGP
jgi:hypothetical protein